MGVGGDSVALQPSYSSDSFSHPLPLLLLTPVVFIMRQGVWERTGTGERRRVGWGGKGKGEIQEKRGR